MMAGTLSLKYLAENSSEPLFRVAAFFIALQTFFIIIFFASRQINQTASGIDFWYLIPLGYIFCMGNCAISIGRVLY